MREGGTVREARTVREADDLEMLEGQGLGGVLGRAWLGAIDACEGRALVQRDVTGHEASRFGTRKRDSDQG